MCGYVTVMTGNRNKSRFFTVSRIAAQPPRGVTCFGQVFSVTATRMHVKKKKNIFPANYHVCPEDSLEIATAAAQTTYEEGVWS